MSIRPTTTKKYLHALQQIRYKIVDMGEHKFSLSRLCRELKLSTSAAAEIVAGGLVKNKGSHGRSAFYEWNTILPNEKMANELIKRMHYRINESRGKAENFPEQEIIRKEPIHFKQRGIDYNDLQDKAKSLSADGKSQREISRQLDVSLGQVNKFLNPSGHIQLTLSEKIIAAFPDYTLLEIKAAIDKLTQTP